VLPALLALLALLALKATVVILLKADIPLKEDPLDNPVLLVATHHKVELLDNTVLLAVTHHNKVDILLKVELPDNPEATHHSKDTVNKATMVPLALLALLEPLVDTHHNKDTAVNKATEVTHLKVRSICRLSSSCVQFASSHANTLQKAVILHKVVLPEATLNKDHQTLLLNNTTTRFHQTKSPNSKSSSKRYVLL